MQMSFCEERFHTINYLAEGNETQRSAYEILMKLKVIQSLRSYDPILIGTVPVDLNIAGSDLDIACEVSDMKVFVQRAYELYGACDGYRCIHRMKDEVDRAVVHFVYAGWPIEIFGQPVPTKQQNGYKHMIVEARILELLGNERKEQIKLLKRSGLKTEPAFGQLLGLQGDPYRALLDMYHWTDEQLLHMVKMSMDEVI